MEGTSGITGILHVIGRHNGFLELRRQEIDWGGRGWDELYGVPTLPPLYILHMCTHPDCIEKRNSGLR